MSNRYCIVIPHYRHAEPLLGMLPNLLNLELPVVVVDDGSGTAVVEQLQSATQNLASFTLLLRAQNGGKGAAMMTGLKHAHQAGFSHAISLDADGQHNVADVPVLRTLADSAPESIVCGRPVFGEDIPAARLYGRMLTNGLVKFVTASGMIKDAMCGLRVYPLEKILPLFDDLGYRTRMEFDVEILVRACWSGLTITSTDTKVVYPEDGASHFKMVADNVRLVAMHTLLILGGLIRLPATLWRRYRLDSTQ